MCLKIILLKLLEITSAIPRASELIKVICNSSVAGCIFPSGKSFDGQKFPVPGNYH